MTVPATTNRVPYAGNGVTLAFAFPYFLIQKPDMMVLKYVAATGVVTLCVLTTDYTISGTAADNGTYPSGVTVNMLVAPPTGTTLVLVRVPDFLQSVHWVDADPDPSAVKELAFDKLTLEVQRLKDQMARTIRLPDGYAGTWNTELPALVPGGSAIVVSADGLTTQFGSAVASTGTIAVPALINQTDGIDPIAGCALQTWIIKGDGASVGAGGPADLSALNPQIAPGTVVGQRILLVGTDNTATVKIANGNSLILNGFYIMQNGSLIELSWDGTNWREISRNEI